jgi:hypothetical protein
MSNSVPPVLPFLLALEETRASRALDGETQTVEVAMLSDERLETIRQYSKEWTEWPCDDGEFISCAYELLNEVDRLRAENDRLSGIEQDLERTEQNAQRDSGHWQVAYGVLNTLMHHVRIPATFISQAELERWWAAWKAGWDFIRMAPPLRPSDGVDGVTMVQSREMAWQRAQIAEAEVSCLRARNAELTQENDRLQPYADRLADRAGENYQRAIRAEKRNAELVKVLRRAEWGNSRCPECYSLPPTHYPDCDMDAALNSSPSD